MTAATENAKIAEAAKGQAKARRQSPKERITSGTTRAALDAADADRAAEAKLLAVLSEPGAMDSPYEAAVRAAVEEETVTTSTVDRPATPAPKPAPKVKTPKGRPVLTEEQKAEAKRLQHVYILAKWARERRERAQARINADKGMSPEDRKAAKQATLDALTTEATTRKAWLAAKAGK